MSKKVRGSYYPHQAPNTIRAFLINQREPNADVGFRLVHDASYRVFRGGSWSGDPSSARVADRFSNSAGRGSSLGFRLVRPLG